MQGPYLDVVFGVPLKGLCKAESYEPGSELPTEASIYGSYRIFLKGLHIRRSDHGSYRISVVTV